MTLLAFTLRDHSPVFGIYRGKHKPHIFSLSKSATFSAAYAACGAPHRPPFRAVNAHEVSSSGTTLTRASFTTTRTSTGASPATCSSDVIRDTSNSIRATLDTSRSHPPNLKPAFVSPRFAPTRLSRETGDCSAAGCLVLTEQDWTVPGSAQWDSRKRRRRKMSHRNRCRWGNQRHRGRKHCQ